MTLEFIQSPSVNKERQQLASSSSQGPDGRKDGTSNSRPAPFQEFEVDAVSAGLSDMPYIGMMNWYSVKHYNYKYKYAAAALAGNVEEPPKGVLDTRRLKFALQQLQEYCPLLG